MEPTFVSPPYRLSSSELVTAIMVLSIFCALQLIGLIFMGLKIWEKCQTGTYRPSSEEQEGARMATNVNLKLPPEERSI